MGFQVTSLASVPVQPGLEFYVFQLGSGHSSPTAAEGQIRRDFLMLAESLGEHAALVMGSAGSRLTSDLMGVMSWASRASALICDVTIRRPGLLILGADPRTLGDEDLLLFVPFDKLDSAPGRLHAFFKDLGHFAVNRDSAFLRHFIEAGDRIPESVDALTAGSPHLGIGLNIARGIREAPEQLLSSQATEPVRRGLASDGFRMAQGDVIAQRYAIRHLLGEGGMGQVYLAADGRNHDRRVALKLLRERTGREPGLSLLAREMDALIALDQIPDLIRIYDSDLEGTPPYIVTEFIDGWNLSDFVRVKCPSREDRLELFIHICEAMHAIHEHELLHRDIKPENVLIRRQRLGGRIRFVICDCGLATRIDGDRADDGVMGTVAYMSPEHFRGIGGMTRRSDVYSLGVMFYWLLTEKLPYPVTSEGFALARAGRWSFEVAPLPGLRLDEHGVENGVPQNLARIAYKALSADAMSRYQTAQELSRAVDEIAEIY